MHRNVGGPRTARLQQTRGALLARVCAERKRRGDCKTNDGTQGIVCLVLF